MSNQQENPISPPTVAGAIADTRRPKLKLPPGSTDCHVHICGPQTRYRYAANRRYTPPDALMSDYLKMARTLGVERAVLVQPSIYMTDNSAMLDAMAERAMPLRGVAVVDANVSDAELERMHALGVRGLRLNLRFENGAPGDIAPKLAARIKPLGWHLQFRINPQDFVNVQPMLEQLPVDAVIDHLGQVPVEAGVQEPSFQILLRLLQSGRCWVKLSAPMRMAKQDYPYADVIPFARALVNANSDRCIWATDWPHTTITKPMPNDGDLVDLLSDWIPDPAALKKVLVDNPAKLYGF
jgi:predicted TIM-barrel fold metal-dependent hydrolase